jgi:glyceraldehyde 3-phosphate dehydrogenase
MKIAVNGLGRIGKLVARLLLEEDFCQELSINSNKITPKIAAYLLNYDSIQGPLKEKLLVKEEKLYYKGKEIKLSAKSQLEELNWEGIDLVLEATGAFNSRSEAKIHLEKGAKAVLVSAPCKNADSTIVMGVNKISGSTKGKVISLGSCTTNCLVPLVKILDESFGIESAFMTTIHAYTNDQALLDSRHQDLRRGRAAESSIIPTSSGVTKVIEELLPNLAGKIDGVALRVPVQNVSMIDLSWISKKQASVEDINNRMKQAAEKLPKILAYNEEPLVSIDFNQSSFSAIFDATQTRVVDNLVRIAAWYDNERGFSQRMVDLAKIIGDNL